MRSEPRMSTWPETFAVPKLANSCGSDVKSKEHRMIHRKFRLVARFATCAAAIVTAGSLAACASGDKNSTPGPSGTTSMTQSSAPAQAPATAGQPPATSSAAITPGGRGPAQAPSTNPGWGPQPSPASPPVTAPGSTQNNSGQPGEGPSGGGPGGAGPGGAGSGGGVGPGGGG